MKTATSNFDLLSLAAQIVSAHISHNAVSPGALPRIIEAVYGTLRHLETEALPVEKPKPAVPVKKPVFPNHVIFREDGKKHKMLRRHLQTDYGMTPEQYRERWGLSRDYPMTAPK